jgi:hypothetical protein
MDAIEQLSRALRGGRYGTMSTEGVR